MFRIIAGCVLLMLCASCKKVTFPPGVAALTVVNGVVGTNSLSPNFKGTEPIVYRSAFRPDYGEFTNAKNNFSLPSGVTPLALFNYPDTLPKSTPLFLFNLDLTAGSMTTLFLTGTVDAPESLLLKDEKFPYHQTADSVMAIRFANLSAGGDGVSVNLISKANGSEAMAVAYKAVTGFKSYDVVTDISDYTFEFRNAITGAFIASFNATEINNDGVNNYNRWINRNFTLALVGTIGATGNDAPKLVLVLHTNT